MTTGLFPYQVLGASFLAERKRALLADDMGLGKSATAIAACDAVGAKTVTVICPASVRENWKREFKRFGTTGIVPSVHSYNHTTTGPLEGNVDVLILDEAHYLKTKGRKRTTAIFGPKCDGVGGLVERAKHVFCLTGTPAPNNPSELWPMLRAVMPEAISLAPVGAGGVKVSRPGPLSYWAFVQKYCVTRDNGFGLQIVKGKNLGELKARIAPFVLRRKKADVLKDLPPIRFDTLPVEGRIDLTPEMEDSAVAVAEALADGGVDGLARIAPHVATLRRLTGLAKVAPVVEWVKDWLEGGGRKIVLFAHHHDVIDGLMSGLKGVRAVALHGELSAQWRQDSIDQFQSDPGLSVFIGQIQAAGTGITLTAASDVLFVESSWVPADNEQAAMRIHRIGQKNACLVRFAMLAGSIDEDIQRAVLRKTADISKLFN